MFRVPGPITMGNASEALTECLRAIDGGEGTLGLDALEHSDSAAVAVLLAVLRSASARGRTIALTGMPPAVTSLAALYGVDAMLSGATAPARAP